MHVILCLYLWTHELDSCEAEGGILLYMGHHYTHKFAIITRILYMCPHHTHTAIHVSPGHGNRIRAKLEAATGNLNAQKAMIDDQAAMDETLKLKTDKIEADIRALQQERICLRMLTYAHVCSRMLTYSDVC